jgi:hypothetical protein
MQNNIFKKKLSCDICAYALSHSYIDKSLLHIPMCPAQYAQI